MAVGSAVGEFESEILEKASRLFRFVLEIFWKKQVGGEIDADAARCCCQLGIARRHIACIGLAHPFLSPFTPQPWRYLRVCAGSMCCLLLEFAWFGFFSILNDDSPTFSFYPVFSTGRNPPLCCRGLQKRRFTFSVWLTSASKLSGEYPSCERWYRTAAAPSVIVVVVRYSAGVAALPFYFYCGGMATAKREFLFVMCSFCAKILRILHSTWP